jgi:hypothetical protein
MRETIQKKKKDAKLYSFAYFNRYVLRRPTGREKILDWAASIQSLPNAQVIPQNPSSTHDQLRIPENLLLKQQNSFSFSFLLRLLLQRFHYRRLHSVDNMRTDELEVPERKRACRIGGTNLTYA